MLGPCRLPLDNGSDSLLELCRVTCICICILYTLSGNEGVARCTVSRSSGSTAVKAESQSIKDVAIQQIRALEVARSGSLRSSACCFYLYDINRS